MFDPDSNTGDRSVVEPIRLLKIFSRGFFNRSDQFQERMFDTLVSRITQGFGPRRNTGEYPTVCKQLLVMAFAFDRLGYIQNPTASGVNQDLVFDRVPFLFPGVVELPVGLVFRPLDISFGAIYNELFELGIYFKPVGEVADSGTVEFQLVTQSSRQYPFQPSDPQLDVSLVQAKQSRGKPEGGICFVVKENEEQFLDVGLESGFTTGSRKPYSGLLQPQFFLMPENRTEFDQ